MKPHKKTKYIELRNEAFVSQVTKASFEFTRNGSVQTCDVLIKCGPASNQVEFYCHKVILSSASNFLYSALLSVEPGTFPILVLPDIKPETVQHILSYVYNGEVWVPLVELSDFYEGCHILGLKGVVERSDSIDENEKDSVDMEEEEEEIERFETLEKRNDVQMEEESSNEKFNLMDQSLHLDESLQESVREEGETDESSSETEPTKDTPIKTITKLEQSCVLEKAALVKNLRNTEKPVMTDTKENPLKVQNELTEESETDESNTERATFVKPHLDKITYKAKENIMKITPGMKSKILIKAKNSLRLVYQKMINPFDDGDLETKLNDTRLVMFGKKLLRANHACGICGYPLSISYKPNVNKSVFWINANLKRHLTRRHGIKFNPTVMRNYGANDLYVRNASKTEETLYIDNSLEIQDDAKEEGETDESSCELPRTPVSSVKIKPRNLTVYKLVKNMIKIAPEMQKEYTKLAKNCVRALYKRLPRKVDGDLETTVNDTKLVVIGKNLIRAEHSCGFCGCPISLNYIPRVNNRVCWKNSSIIRHLRTIHKIRPISKITDTNMKKD